MNRSPAPSKVLLVADPRSEATETSAAPIRRFRIARLHVEPRPLQGRPERLRRVAD